MFPTRFICAAVALSATAGSQCCAQNRFIRLPSAGGVSAETFVNGLSADGRFAVGRDGSTSMGNAAARWDLNTNAELVLGQLPGMGSGVSEAYNASADGAVVVGYGFRSDTGDRAFRWEQSTGMVTIGDLPGGTMESTGLAISGNGQVLGGWGNSTNGTEAFRWTSGSGMVGLGDLPGGPFGSAVTAMSQDGNVLAGSGSTQDGLRAFRWTQQSGMMDIGTLTGSTTTVYGMSLDGSTIVGSSDRRAYRWTQGAGMSALLVAGGGNSEAKAASLDGSIIVGNGLPGAVMWLPGQQLATALQPYLSNELHLDLMGWTLFSCDAISADGRVIAGYGHDAGGRVRAWAAVIPSPSTGGIALAIWAVCAGRRRRHVVAG